MQAADAPLSDWLTWLESLSPTEIELGLDRVGAVLERLALPRPPHLLLIAGTNGKGSCVAMSSNILQSAGLRVGAYTSPHIRRFNERIAIDGVAASDDELIAAFRTVEKARGDTRLTYFEFGTLAAAVHFSNAQLDVWVLEVGLGGRLDATNVFEPTASLITNVSLDHCDWLGPDVEAIGAEKAGVMRPGRPTVFGNTDIPASVLKQAEKISATCLLAGRDFRIERYDNNSNDRSNDMTWDWRGAAHSFHGLGQPGLPGAFQVENAAATLALLEAADLLDGVDRDLINRVLPHLSLPGRMQTLSLDGIDWIIDVAHNAAAAQGLAANLRGTGGDGAVTAVIGLLDDKDSEAIIQPLLPLVDRWIAVTPDSARAVPAVELSRRIANQANAPCLIAATSADAIRSARRNATESDRILVTGSFFTVGPMLAELDEVMRSAT